MADIEFNLTGNAEEVAKQIDEYLKSIAEDTEDILQRTKNGLIDTTQAQKELDELLKKYRQLKNEAGKEGYGEIFTSFEKNFTKGFSEARKQAKGWGDYFKQYSSKVISIVTTSLKKGFQTAFSAAKGITRTVFNGMIASFKGLGSLLKNSLSKVFSFGNGNGLFGNLTKLITLLGGLTLGKKLVDLSSEMYEFGRIADNVFGENAKEVEDWAKTVGSAYVDSTNAAQKYLSTIGIMLSKKGIDGDNLKEMSENVVKLTGDFANFYNLSKDDAFNKIQKALEGSAKALKDYGINVSDANVNAYLLAQGYKVQLSSLSEAEQQMVRYNYLLSENASIMGASANTATTWANQVDSLKGKLTEMGALLGNLLVKVLYPIIVALNTAADVALKFLSALAPIFNFDSESMKGILGGGGSTAVDNLEDEADAIDDVAKSAKKANAQLQGFDKLNNMATSGDSSSKKGTGIGSIGMALSDWKGLPPADVKLPEWLQKLLNVLKAKDWKGLGKLFAEGINYITNALRSNLTDPNTYENISKLNTALIDLLKGILSADFTNAGRMIGDFVNLLTFTIKDFFVKGIEEGVFTDAGKDLSDAIAGMIDEVDWTQAGESLTVGLRALLEGISSFLTTAKDKELGKKAGEAFREFIGGALEMLLGNGGDEKAGKTIADFINLALDFVINSLSSTDSEQRTLGDELSQRLGTTITNAIQNIDGDKLKDAAVSVAQLITKILGTISDLIKTNKGKMKQDAQGVIDGLVDSGTLTALAQSFVELIIEVGDIVASIITPANFFNVAGSIITAIGNAIKDDPQGAANLGALLAGIFTTSAFINGFSSALSVGGSVGTNALSNMIAKKIAGNGASIGTAVGEAASSQAAVSSATSGMSSFASSIGTVLVYALAAYVGKKIGDTVGSAITKELARVDLEDLEDTLDTINVDKIGVSDENITKLRQAEEAYQGMSDAIGKFNERYADVSTTDFNLIDDVARFASSVDLKNNLLETAQAIKNSGVEMQGLDDAIQLLSGTYISFGSQSEAIIKAMALLGDGFVDVEYAIQKYDDTLDASVSVQDDFATALQHISDSFLTLDSIETEESLKGLVTEAVQNAKDTASQKGIELSDEMVQGAIDTLDTSPELRDKLQVYITEAIAETSVTANDKGAELSEDITTGMTEGLDNETLSDGLNTTIIDGVEASKETYTEQGKTLGEYITDGIVEGLSGNEGILKITSAIKALCDEMEKSFRDNLEIHSPSRLFTRLTEYVPEGAAQGIENKLPLIEDSMAKVRSSMIEGFDSDLLTKIRNSFSDLTFEANLEASKTATQSNSRLEEGLASLIRGTGNASGNQNIVVQLVLDGNVMQKFVLDTVNGNAVQNGGF